MSILDFDILIKACEDTIKEIDMEKTKQIYRNCRKMLNMPEISDEELVINSARCTEMQRTIHNALILFGYDELKAYYQFLQKSLMNSSSTSPENMDYQN